MNSAIPEKRGTVGGPLHKMSVQENEQKMTRRELVRKVYEGDKPPYIPWHFTFTREAWDKLRARGTDDIQEVLRGHILDLGGTYGSFEDIGNACFEDVLG